MSGNLVGGCLCGKMRYTIEGEPMFVARARLLVPAKLELTTLRSALEALGNELMVDLSAE